MNKRFIGVVAVAFLLAVVNYMYLSGVKAEATGGQKVAVLESAVTLAAGKQIRVDQLGVRMVPKAYIDDRTVLKSEANKVDQLVLRVGVKRGQLLQWSDFEQTNGKDETALAEMVMPGERAMTIPVNASLSLGGMLRPGDRVDVIGTFLDDAARARTRGAVTVLQNISVLATGKNMGNDDGATKGFGSVTLSVTVTEGELLAMARELGTLSLVLRGHQDLEVATDVPVVGTDMLFDVAAPGRWRKGTTAHKIERLEEER